MRPTSIAAVALALGLLVAPSSQAADHTGSLPPPRVTSQAAPPWDRPLPSPTVGRQDPAGGSGTDTRPTAGDAPDAIQGAQTHVVYFVPLDGEDQSLDAPGGPLSKAIDSIRAWFARETGNAGGAAIRPRFDRRESGNWDISFVRGSSPASAYAGIDQIAADLAAQGYDKREKRYLVYAALSANAAGNPGGICGESYYPLPGFQERNYAVVYLNANQGCGARDFGNTGTAGGAGRSETIAVHEWLHNEGVAPLTAPRHCTTSLYHVCTGPLWMVPASVSPEGQRIDPEASDILFPLVWRKLGDTVLDRGRDDYLDHAGPWTDLRDSIWME